MDKYKYNVLYLKPNSSVNGKRQGEILHLCHRDSQTVYMYNIENLWIFIRNVVHGIANQSEKDQFFAMIVVVT